LDASRALSKPGRVSYQTAEHVRRVAEQLGYRTGHMKRAVSERGTGMLGIIVADIANPVFFGMIRGAKRAASDRGFTMLVVETQEFEEVERAALDHLIPAVDGVILSSSRMSDSAIRIRDETAARKLAAIEAHDEDPKTLLTPSHAV
jgi:DNA-binding LacI/PurR family transcriptional regulator